MDTNLLSMSQQFSGLPMESLIGGPLNAAAKANSAMALTQTKFTLPLLTILPINSLAVETVDINFEMEVKSSFSEDDNQAKESETTGEGSFETKIGWGLLSTTIKGSASYSSKDSSSHNTHYEKSNSAKYTVNVHAGQLPLPKGVNTIIEAFTQAIQPIELTPAKTPEGGNTGNGNAGGDTTT